MTDPHVTIEAGNVTDAWLRALPALLGRKDNKAIHTVVRIADPIAESAGPRGAVDGLLADLEWDGIETVANTIFPTQLARTSRTHDQLVARYRKMYPVLRNTLPINQFGTYFGRLVAYPTEDGQFDQLGAVIENIGVERRKRSNKAGRYEALIARPGDLVNGEAGPDDYEAGGSHSTPVFLPGYDTRPMGFPCLSHCSFQLRGDRLHLVAHYRYQYMVHRAYGNYLGLGRLLHHAATQAGVATGQLTVVAGMAWIESPAVVKVKRLLRDHA